MTVSEEQKEIWNEACELTIEGSSSPERIRNLLNDAVLEHFDDSGITLAFSNAMKKGGVDRSYIDDIKDALYVLTDREMSVQTIVDKTIERPQTVLRTNIPQYEQPQNEQINQPLSSASSSSSYQGYQEIPPVQPIQEEPERKQTPVHTSDLKYTFDNFVVGESNQFAFSAAQAVAENPGSPMRNPLFIYGKSGLGKTHLLCAIDNYLREYYPTKKTIYVQAKDIVDDVMNARVEYKDNRSAAWQSFRQKYNQMDVIMVDDIQFLEGKEESTEQVFQIFNEFIALDKQIVLSADRAPKEINMDERMRSRFNNGLTIDIKPPTFETKLGIIKLFAKNNFPDMVLTDDVYNYIVEISNSNIRDIEGAMNKVGYYHLVFGKEVDRDITQQILKDFFPDKNLKKIEISFIQREVEKKYGISHEEMTGKKRERRINNPRQIAMYLSREMTPASFPEIGKKFNRDHTTIMNGVDNIEKKMKENMDFYNEIQTLTEMIKEKA